LEVKGIFMKLSVFFVILNIFSSISAFGADSTLHSIIIDGASSLTAAVQPSAIEFAKKQSVGVSVHNQGSKVAMACLSNKTCHIGFIPTDSLPEDKNDFVITPYAISGLEIVVGKGAGVTSLTTAQLQSIYSRTVKNWKDVGGNDLPIDLYRRRESSGLHKHLATQINIPSDIRELSTSDAVFNVLGKSPGAITYVNSGSASSDNYKSIKFNGAAPTLENYKSGAYPLTIKYYLVMRKDVAADPHVKELSQQLINGRAKFFTEAGMLIP
jgi:phosphate transport system substrate-binding protein